MSPETAAAAAMAHTCENLKYMEKMCLKDADVEQALC